MNAQKFPEIGIAAPKLRSNALIDRWPRERREQILDWINQGLSLRRVSQKIRQEYGITIHHTTLGKFYARERRRNLQENCLHANEFFDAMAAEQTKSAVDLEKSVDYLLRMEFVRYYQTQQLTPTQFIQFFRALMKQRELAASEEKKPGFSLFPSGLSPWHSPLVPPKPTPKL